MSVSTPWDGSTHNRLLPFGMSVSTPWDGSAHNRFLPFGMSVSTPWDGSTHNLDVAFACIRGYLSIVFMNSFSTKPLDCGGAACTGQDTTQDFRESTNKSPSSPPGCVLSVSAAYLLLCCSSLCCRCCCCLRCRCESWGCCIPKSHKRTVLRGRVNPSQSTQHAKQSSCATIPRCTG